MTADGGGDLATINLETGEIISRTEVLMTKDEALAITAEIKSWSTTLWQKLKQAHDGQAWRALGYKSWRAYIDTEFEMGKSQAYRLLTHANAVYEIAGAAGLDPEELSPAGDTFTERQTRGLDLEAVTEAIRIAMESIEPGAKATRAEIAARITKAFTDLIPKDAPKNPAPDAGAPASPAPVSDQIPDEQAPPPGAPSGGQEGAPASTPPALSPDPVEDPSADGGQSDDDEASGQSAPQRLVIVPHNEDGSPSVADLMDWWPSNGQWRAAIAELGIDESPFGRFMDLREPRDIEDPTELAKSCPPALRPGAAKALRIGAQHLIDMADALERPTPLTIVEEA